MVVTDSGFKIILIGYQSHMTILIVVASPILRFGHLVISIIKLIIVSIV